MPRSCARSHLCMETPRLSSGLSREPKTRPGDLCIVGIEFDQRGAATKALRRQGAGATAAERIEYPVTWAAASLDAALGQTDRHGGKMSTPKRRRRDRPDVAGVGAGRLCNRVGIVEVATPLAEQEHHL